MKNKMEMTQMKSSATFALAVIGLAAIFVLSFATVPLALASTAGSNYPIELMRAHADYKVVDPVIAQVGLGVWGNR